MVALSLEAMLFARNIHSHQRRKYTDSPYVDHLAEVAGIVSTVCNSHPDQQISLAVSWLHDSIEDQGITRADLASRFGESVAEGVMLLSDLETGNRGARKAAARERLAKAPGWIQDIKVADLISNTMSIVQHDPRFARIYLAEKNLLLDVLTKANPVLVNIARTQCQETSDVE